MTKRRGKLTELQWENVFRARCLSKRGLPLTEDQQALVNAAYREDRKRYAAMEARVFNETVPFGSTVRMKEEPDD